MDMYSLPRIFRPFHQYALRMLPHVSSKCVAPVVHFIEAAYFGMWWLLPTACLGGISEILGWAARFWSSRNPQNLNPYIMQYVFDLTVQSTAAAKEQ